MRRCRVRVFTVLFAATSWLAPLRAGAIEAVDGRLQIHGNFDTVMRVVPQLIANGRYARPSLGIESQEDLNERLKRASGIDGVFVLRIDPGSAAERAGLVAAQRSGRGVVPGDVVVALNGKPVSRLGDLLARLDDFGVGETVELTLLRGGERRTVALALEAGS